MEIVSHGVSEDPDPAGPNFWARFPVLEAWVDLGVLKDSPSDELPGFNERLMAWLPTLVEHRCSVGTRGGFFERLRRGPTRRTSSSTSAGAPDPGRDRGRLRPDPRDLGGRVYKVALEYVDESFAKASLHAARELCLAAVYDRPFDVAAEIARLRALTSRCGSARAPAPSSPRRCEGACRCGG